MITSNLKTEIASDFTGVPEELDDVEVTGGWWATEKEAKKFLNLESLQEVFDLANRKLSKRRCASQFDERDIQRLGPRKFRVWCCKPNAAGGRRPRIVERKA